MPDFREPKDPTPWKEESGTEQVARATVQQRVTLWALGLIALVTAVFGILQIRSTLTTPFIPKYSNENSPLLALEEQELQELQELQNKDTDQDGLNDYEELYTYDTSPYLADSDSDGESDRQELESGNNPNCPIGQSCDEARRESTDQTTGEAGETPAAGEPSLDTIREVLKNAGAPAEMVDTIDDNELRKLYNETVAETGQTLDGETTESSEAAAVYSDLQADNPFAEFENLDDETIEALLNLPPAEIRQLLIEVGGDETLIQSLPDESLQAIFRQAISQFADSTTAEANTENTQNTNEAASETESESE